MADDGVVLDQHPRSFIAGLFPAGMVVVYT
jgi:hypothetical protein